MEHSPNKVHGTYSPSDPEVERYLTPFVRLSGYHELFEQPTEIFHITFEGRDLLVGLDGLRLTGLVEGGLLLDAPGHIESIDAFEFAGRVTAWLYDTPVGDGLTTRGDVARRAARAARFVEAYADETGLDPEADGPVTLLGDLLSDLMHLYGPDTITQAIAAGEWHYEAETTLIVGVEPPISDEDSYEAEFGVRS